MLLLGEVAPTADAARRAMEVALSSGRAAVKLQEIIAAQGGDPVVVDEPARLPQSRECELYLAPRAGIVSSIDPRAVGRGITAMGGGRTRIEEAIDPSVGFVIVARPGDLVHRGEPLATVCARDPAGIEIGMATLREALTIGDEADLPLPLISHRVSAAGAELFEEELV
jgi:thymidine phosphorylase